MGKDKTKEEFELTRTEVAEYLRRVAKGFESNRYPISETEIDLEKVKSLEMSLKNRGDTYKLKVTLKFFPPSVDGVSPEEVEEDIGKKESYKRLKKRISKSFKMIRRSLDLGTLPDTAVISSFVADSRAMTTYPDKGEPHYSKFNKTIKEFERAFGESDIIALKSATRALRVREKECHDLYK